MGATRCCSVWASHCGGFSCRGAQANCSTQAPWVRLTGSRAQAQWLRRVNLVAPWHVESSWARGGTCVPCIGSWTLIHQGSPIISFNHFLWFSVYKSWTSLKFIPKYFILFDAVVNGIIFLIHFLNSIS